jgi:hypothetical protein
MYEMNPVEIGPVAVDPIDKHPRTRRARDYRSRDGAPETVESMVGQRICAGDPGGLMNVYVGTSGEVGIDAIADEMDGRAGRAQVRRELRVGAIHPARAMKVTGDQHPFARTGAISRRASRLEVRPRLIA